MIELKAIRLSLDVHGHSGYGEDEWITVPASERNRPRKFIEECVHDYLNYHFERIREIHDLHEDMYPTDIALAEIDEYIDVTYHYSEAEEEQ